MNDSNITPGQCEAIEKAILNGDVHLLEQFLIDFKDDPFTSQWDEALKAHNRESANYFEKACTM